jgi:membrane-bound lytic murein transglycosylase B
MRMMGRGTRKMLAALAVVTVSMGERSMAQTPPASSPDVSAFVATLWPLAEKAGIARTTFDAALAGVTVDTEIAGLNAAQPEFAKTAGDYVGLLVSEKRIAGGREKLGALNDLLAALEAKHGVERQILVAIWGIESSFGTATGQRPVIRSLATLAMTDARRADFWRSELLAALSILERRDITPELMLGSWAGAMGHTQFMPSTFQRFAVDFDGDGRRDLWTTPMDALASAGNYLKASGWTTGMPWGFEVWLPKGFDFGASGPEVTRAMAQWQALGVNPARPQTLPANLGALQLILPAGAHGPAFLVTTNFKVILRYNRAVPYALAVGHLSDRLVGRDELVQPWPVDDKALSKTEREELQTLLQRSGFDVGAIDGVVGTQTRTAVRAFQRARGLVEDGHPGSALVERLRNEAKP